MTHTQSVTPVIITVTGVSLTGLAAYLHHKHQHPPEPIEPPARFTNQNITLRFTASLPEITRDLNLELATCQQTETFTQTNECSLLWGWLNLGTNTAQVSVPVTYRYHVHLRESWQLETQGDLVIVHAPVLRAALPPAIDTEHMMTLSVRGWARVSPEPMLEDLKRQITPRLTALANDLRRLNLVRDTCRKSVAEFVRLWLERERQWGQSGFTRIQVKFGDEPTLPLAPTVKLL